MTGRTKVIVGVAAVVVIFLLGFAPQYRTAAATRAELRTAQQEIESLRTQVQMGELRDLLALTYLETTAMNYGLAREHSTRFFTRASDIANQTPDSSLRTLLHDLLKDRDRITAALAEGKGAAQADVEAMLRRLYGHTAQ